MMVEYTVALFLDKLNEMLVCEASLRLTQETRLPYGVVDQVRMLRDELIWMRPSLQYVDDRRREDERIKNWATQFKDAASEAENAIDMLVVKVEAHRLSVRFRGYLRICFSIPKEPRTLHAQANEIEKFKRRIERISVNKTKFGIKSIEPGGEDKSSSYLNRGLPLSGNGSPVIEELDVVGFEDDMKLAALRLLQEEPRRVVFSILGVGGLGKTTLAKKVYDKVDLRRNFECCTWVCASEGHRVKRMLLEITNSVMILPIQETEKMDEEELGKKLFDYLKERRYLVVIDDIQTTEAWSKLSSFLPEGMKGSRIMLTTSNRDIPLLADAQSPAHELQSLKEEESWELFCRKVSPDDICTDFPQDLEDMGRDMVQKFHDLPLAVVVLGGLLQREDRSLNVWMEVMININSELRKGENQITRILALGYNLLPYYLKPCFLYFGLFPKGSKIPTKKLLRLWVAEGFIQQQGEATLEEVAEQYLQELINRSMIEAVRVDIYGGVAECCIHDLLRDLSISEARQDKFLDIQVNANFLPAAATRRLAINWSLHENSAMKISPSLHSLLCFNSRSVPVKFLFNSRSLLRVLDLEKVYIQALPSEIVRMVHLRYLGLRYTYLKKLPPSIGRLYNLQYLDLRGTSVERVPNAIWKMKNLRHLYLDWGNCPMVGARIGWLSDIQILSGVKAGRWIARSLSKLTNLKKLGIRGVSSKNEKPLSKGLLTLSKLCSLKLAGQAVSMEILSLSDKFHLRKLYLSAELEKQLPDYHSFPTNLTKLTLEHSQLEQDPLTTLEKLPGLRFLSLLWHSYVGKEMVCSKGGFPQLQELRLGALEEIEEWRVEKEAMPSLSVLDITLCSKLKIIPEGLQHVTTLQKLKLVGMPNEFNARVQKIKGEDWYKIQHVPFITIRS